MKLSVETHAYSPCNSCMCPKDVEANCGINYRSGS